MTGVLKHFTAKLILGALCLTAPLFAAPNDCVTGVLRLAPVNQFWKQDTPFLLERQDGGRRKQSVTFGFDAELWDIHDIYNLLSQRPTDFAKLKQALKDSPSYSDLYDLAKDLGISERAAKQKLRGPVPENGFSLLELKAEAFKKVKTTPKMKSDWADATHELVDKSLRARGIPVNAVLEESSGGAGEGDHAVELVMKGAKKTPKQFSDILEKFLYKDVKSPETHFHMAFPSSAITSKQMSLIGRAAEARIVFDETLRNFRYTSNFHPYDNSAIAGYVGSAVDRGVIRIDMDRWEKPYPAHDVEMRQWLSLRHAKELLHFMGELALNKDRLRDTSNLRVSEVPAIMPANLNATLRYMSHLLKNRLPPNKSGVIRKLKDFADKIENSGGLSDELRTKISRYLKDQNLKEYMTIKLFLE